MAKSKPSRKASPRVSRSGQKRPVGRVVNYRTKGKPRGKPLKSLDLADLLKKAGVNSRPVKAGIAYKPRKKTRGTHGIVGKPSHKISRKPGGAYRIVGRTSDGVVILGAKAKSKHFTSRQIRSAINQVERAGSIRA